MQPDMFRDWNTSIVPATHRVEPRLWVRRLVIWEKPERIIRDIPLKRGLNVVWSPDPGGHGAGKTLFCRFIRYCLGEDTFANDEQRRQIVNHFKEGFVGAEVLVNGTLWSVIRPIGLTRKHMVGEGVTLDRLLTENPSSTGMAPFLEAISEHLSPNQFGVNLPSVHKEWNEWLLALAWATRDQENRLAHILEWRHSSSDSRTSISSTSKTDLILVTRVLLDMITTDEPRLRTKEAQIKSQRTRAEKDIPYFDRRRDELAAELSRALDFQNVNFLSTELAFDAMKQAAAKNLASVNATTVSPELSDEIKDLSDQRDALIAKKAVLQQQFDASEGMISLHEERINVLRGKRSNLNAEDIKARLGGDLCPVCFVPIDKALEEGCDLKKSSISPQNISVTKQEIDEQLRSCEDAIARAQTQRRELETIIRGYENEEARLKAAISAAKVKENEEQRKLEQSRVQARRLVEKSEEMARSDARKLSAEKSLKDLDRDEDAVKLELQAIRAQHGEKMRRFEEIFQYVCAALGVANRASLKLQEQRWEARVDVGGTAMDSLKVIAFDLAALVMSIEGRAHLPAFWIHDSPREADLGPSYYEKIFFFARYIERLSDQPTFQYIITTTTEPPPDFRKAPYLIETLDGLVAQERLLRCNL